MRDNIKERRRVRGNNEARSRNVTDPKSAGAATASLAPATCDRDIG